MILNEMSFVCAKVEPCYETNQTFFYLILNEMAKVCITENCTFTFDNDSEDKIKSSYLIRTKLQRLNCVCLFYFKSKR